MASFNFRSAFSHFLCAVLAELLQSVGAQEKELIEPERETVDVRLLLADLREYSGV